MKLLLLALTLSILSCSQQKNENTEEPPVPKALEEQKSDYSLVSKVRYSNDLVQELYNEIIEKDKELKDLETAIINIRSRQADSLENFNNFDQKNNSYYQTAKSYLAGIKDSVLKKRIEQIVTKSSESYKNLTIPHQQLVLQTKALEEKLNEVHISLKLVSTLALMEKFQKEYLPSKQPIIMLNKTYGQVIHKVDTLLKR
jgi:hypothetical protein